MALSKKQTTEPSAPTHRLPSDLLNTRLQVALVGCGGNGSQMLTKLARLDFALRELGRPGLMVTVYDHDLVSPSNIGRQLFSRDDIGLHKSLVLVNRLNMSYGLQWLAQPKAYEPHTDNAKFRPHVLITCVDTAKTRADIWNAIRKQTSNAKPKYWLDLGNSRDSGQVILGQPPYTDEIIGASVPVQDWVSGGKSFNAQRQLDAARREMESKRLLCVTEVFPELLDRRRKEDDTPSCSLAEALEKQSLFVNDAMTSWAAQLLDELIRIGKINYHGVFVNLQNGSVRALPIRERAIPATLTLLRASSKGLKKVTRKAA